MALETYTGRVTDYSRKPFTTSEQLSLQVVPAQSGYGGLGLLAKKPIPVTVASNGSFSFELETSSSVRPQAVYTLQAQWLGDAGWTDWVKFQATAGGGNIKDIVQLAPPPGAITWGYGPPPSDLSPSVIYLDLSGMAAEVFVPVGSGL